MALKLKRLVSSPNEHDDGSSFNVLSNVSPAKKWQVNPRHHHHKEANIQNF